MDWTPIVIPLAILAAVGTLVWHYERAQSILLKWARENGYRIIDCERRWLRRGPFFFTTSKSQVVYHLAVETESGELRHGYVRCGSYFGGLLSNQVVVRWDPEVEHRPGFPVVISDEANRNDGE